MQPDEQSRIFDYEAAIEQLAGDAELFREMANLYLLEKDAYVSAISDAFSANDANALRREAHSVKSVFASFVCEGGRVAAATLESSAALGNCAEAAPQVSEVVAQLEKLAAALAA